MKKFIGRAMFVLGVITIFAVAVGLLALGNQYRLLAESLPSTAGLRNYRPSQTTKIFARNGQLLATLFRENRTWTPLGAVPKLLPKALVAVEDKRFYQHNGVDLRGLGRAVYTNLRGQDVQGGSTLTMQLARNLFLSPERSVKRKLREMMLAQRIEEQLSKDEILQLYLNKVYLGAGAYGVDAASQVYFGKNPKSLTPAQVAMLVGLPQAPEQASPLVDLKRAKDRTLEVLTVMREANLLTTPEFKKAVAETKAYRPARKVAGGNKTLLKYPYFTSYVIKQLSLRYDERTLYEGGLKIYTTLDIPAQQKAEATVKNLMAAQGRSYNADSAALVNLDHTNGQIRAMVGGRGWTQKNQFNRAWQAYRQPGSTFKMFVYAAALDAGYTPNQMVDDKPITFKQEGGPDWSPKNSDGRFVGRLPLWSALAQSRNVVAARLVYAVGPGTVLQYANRMGVAKDAKPYLSMALGAVDASPLEMASAAGTIANDGVRYEPTAVTLVTDANGHVLEDNRHPQGVHALASGTARLLTHMLVNVVERGTGTAARLSDRPVAGKTGTSDGARDGWFVGYTPEQTTAVWVGNDDHSPTWGCYGGTLPAYIWHDYMAAALPAPKVAGFPTLTGELASNVVICKDTGMLAGPTCPKKTHAHFDPSVVPEACTMHTRSVQRHIQLVMHGDDTVGYEDVYPQEYEAPITVTTDEAGVPTYSNQ